MKCIKCTDSPKTVGQVRTCKFCREDRTANEIPHEMPDDTLIEDALARKPGLSNRFVAERSSSVVETPPAAEAPKKKRRKILGIL